MKKLTPKTNPGALASLKSVADRAQVYAEQSRAANTKKAYRSDWQHFSAWCYENGLDALPATPETVTLYITRFAEDYKVSTLERRLAAISQAHKPPGTTPLPSPRKNRCTPFGPASYALNLASKEK